jgi:hypothetical protein
VRPLLIALTLANGADVASTAVVLSQGGREANLLLPDNVASIAATTAGKTVIELWGLHVLEREHPKLARGVAAGLLALQIGVDAHNVRVAVQWQRGW